MPVKSVVIVGAGIAGLTAALSFARRGIRCDIVEQASALVEVGAGLQMSPNAARILAALDVLPLVEKTWLEPETVDLVSGLSLKTLVSLPMKQSAASRWQAPYGVLHRASLQKALLTAVANTPLCRLHLGVRIEGDWRDVLARIVPEIPDLVVGADGVWSSLRGSVESSPKARFSGYVAWRFMLSADDAPAFLHARKVMAFLGPSAHLVVYPLSKTGSFNIVAIAPGYDPGKTWTAEVQTDEKDRLIRQFRNWNPAFAPLFERAAVPTYWPLFEAGQGRWHNGRDTVLIGDAAHAMMPFAAQGAAMAIEDGFELASFLAGGHDIGAALSAFAAHRRPRIEQARRRAAINRLAYHARGPLRIGRDILLSHRPPEKFLADFDWLYGYRAKGL